MFLCAHFVWKVPQLECTGNLRGRPGSPGSVGWRCAATCLIPQAVQTKNASDLVQWIFNQSVCVCSVCCILMQKEYYKTVWISTCAEIAVVSTAQHIEREHQLEWAVSGTCQKSIRESLATKKHLSQAVQKPLESSTSASRGSSTEGLSAYHHLFTSSLHQSIQQRVGSHASLDQPRFRIPSHILSEGTTSGRYTGAHGFTGHGQWQCFASSSGGTAWSSTALVARYARYARRHGHLTGTSSCFSDE